MLLQGLLNRTFFLIFVVVIYYYLTFISPTRATDNNGISPLSSTSSNATLGFGDIFIVRTPSLADRHDGVLLQAALSHIRVKLVEVSPSVTPSKTGNLAFTKHRHVPKAFRETWQAHIKSINEVLVRNISSALVLEDIVDWDVRIREQLRDFAQSAQALTGTLADRPNLRLEEIATIPQNASSPYGQDWDVLWLGHCGVRFVSLDDSVTPKGRVAHYNDETVAEKRFLWGMTQPIDLINDYPQHTRVVHYAREGKCSLAYAVSQRGARELLHMLESERIDLVGGFDQLLRVFCDRNRGRQPHICLSVSPALFQTHRPVDRFRNQAVTDMVRWSVRLNAEALLNGASHMDDQYPNEIQEDT
ncbi:hypothetical protein Micbo1qcDRAFT_154268 [Microdochium bolleyi]|uniref:Glycosyltransferase family 25 protein n=1 Tax=Microdochium bolleyi TaxID=196109 RepID=A0A136IKK0_9PEZI|nr:hypothetical protein Micbo1qcDRAFT_154268 [Microdochium bolleyi]